MCNVFNILLLIWNIYRVFIVKINFEDKTYLIVFTAVTVYT